MNLLLNRAVFVYCVLLLARANVAGATHYVDATSTNALPPFSDWGTAARAIQDAVDAASAGDEVVVTNGVYATGGRVLVGSVTNRVAVDKPLVLRSVNGPQFTFIQGYRPAGGTGPDAIRCAYLTNGVFLSGFTLTNGGSSTTGDLYNDLSAGGVLCASTEAAISNCTFVGNSAVHGGGGVEGGTLTNCTLVGNSAGGGGGAFSATLYGCLLSGNGASYGGGANASALYGCRLSGNWAAFGGGASGGYLENCIVSGNAAGSEGGGASEANLHGCLITGNTSEQYGGGVFYSTIVNCTVVANSARYGGGTAGVAGGPGTGAHATWGFNSIIYFNSATRDTNYDLFTYLNSCWTSDPKLASISHLSASSPCRGAGDAQYATGTDIDGEPWNNPPSIGCDEYRPGNVVGPLQVAIAANFTNVTVGYPVMLSANIEGQLSDSVWDFGDGVVVSNSIFVSHAWAALGSHTVTLRAYNDTYPGGVSASQTIRVAENSVHYVAAGSTNPAQPYALWSSAAATIQDAVDIAVPGDEIIVTNGVYRTGGRIASGALMNRVAVRFPLTLRSVNGALFTVICGDQSPGSNGVRCVSLMDDSRLIGFTLTNGSAGDGRWSIDDYTGGGAWCSSTNVFISDCLFTGNQAGAGGGVLQGTVDNSVFIGNQAGSGGAAALSTLNNCTVISNSAPYGSGTFSCTANNSIIYYSAQNDYAGNLRNCCTTPLPAGSGNFTNEPAFLDLAGGDLRLQSNSPCINAGLNAFAQGPADLGGNPRIVRGTVDVGAFEYQGAGSLIAYAWLQEFGLTVDGSADFADPDHDGMNNWQEWVCGTDPTNSMSTLRLFPPVPTATGVILTWESVPGVDYFLERSSDVASPFTLLATNLIGQAVTTAYADTNATGSRTCFYRVGVSPR